MKTTLSWKQNLTIASMLFGLFFGAGNLIFPVSMGQQAGHLYGLAALGFSLTGVGLPLLGIGAMAKTESKSLFEFSSLVGKKFAYFFTLLLYLTIGPLFAIPRTATVSFQVGIAPLIQDHQTRVFLAIFSLLFFAVVLYFSLKPSEILKWIGRILNPLFLFFLAILLVQAVVNPMGVTTSAARGAYQSQAFFTGFLEGYNTMDALASLAFGILLVQVIHGLGIKDSQETAKTAMKSGVLSSVLMILIYFLLTWLGSQSVSSLGQSANGGIAFFQIAQHYFGTAGGILLGLIFTIACIKTSIGLVTSISETFCELFPRGVKYRPCAIGFSLVSFLIANTGLGTIMKFSIPVLLFLYPLTIVLIFLGWMGNVFHQDLLVYRSTMAITVFISSLGLVQSMLVPLLPSLSNLLGQGIRALPLSSIGMPWLVPTCMVFVGSVLLVKKNRKTSS